MANDELKVNVTGLSTLAFACIPAALLGAALMYLSFYTGIIDWQKAQRIEGRMDNRVGVNGELTKPVDLIITKKSCLIIDRAFMDGQTGTAYLHNKCDRELSYIALHWNAIAPDGTIIKSGYENSIDGFGPDTVFEKGFSTKSKGTNYGIGLHWCANAISALGGRIWAASDGPGLGASMHLVLPLVARNSRSGVEAA